MSDVENVVREVNDVLRAYNYLDQEDEDIELNEIPSLISHILLLRVFTQEAVRFGIPYEEIEEFCDFSVDYLSQRQEAGDDVSSVDIEEIVDTFRSKGLKH